MVQMFFIIRESFKSSEMLLEVSINIILAILTLAAACNCFECNIWNNIALIL